jgi:hypothetical protein
MTAARLEELAGRALACADDTEVAIEAHLSVTDIRDLARCARAWAKVELAKERTGNHTWFIVSDRHGFTLDTAWAGEHDEKLTAIAAVEAAPEVKP